MESGNKKETMHSEESCKKGKLAVKDTLDIVSGKWKLELIIILMNGKRKFRELSREAGISPKILSKELQELEINGLVNREVLDTKPVSVEYSVTPYCLSLNEVFSSLHKWGKEHRERVTGGDKPA